MRRLAVFICSFGYLGFFPIAPGTVGSLAGLAVYLLCRRFNVPHGELASILGLFVVGVVMTAPAEQELGCVDPGPIVIDEVMGMLMTLFLVPVGWTGLLVGFLLFRLFDVVKPFPARRLEDLHGGFGVMCDDAMAAVYANLALRACHWFAPAWIS